MIDFYSNFNIRPIYLRLIINHKPKKSLRNESVNKISLNSYL